MGACFSSYNSSSSSSRSSNSSSCAKVISLNGQLHEFPVPSTVSQLLRCLDSTGSFVCNSDSLYYDEYIPALDVDQNLEANQIYFVLPLAKLQHRLTASDMAALAVRASLALQQGSLSSTKPSNNNQIIRGTYNSNHNKKARISPVVLLDQQDEVNGYEDSGSATTIKSFSANTNNGTSTPSQGVPRSGSIRRLQKYSSKRVKLAARSFKLRLTTIYEGSVLYV